MSLNRTRRDLRRAYGRLSLASRVLAFLEAPDEQGQHIAPLEVMAQFLGVGRGVLISVCDELESVGYLGRSADRLSVELTGNGLKALREAKAEGEVAGKTDLERSVEAA